MDDYYTYYCSIQNLLIKAYCDKQMILSIDSISKTDCLDNSQDFVLGHLCELLKSDLANNIWKVFLDDSSKSINLYKLNSIIHTKYKHNTSKLPSVSSELKGKIVNIRNHYISHNDAEHDSCSVSTDELYELLDKLKDTLNQMCFPDLDDRVKQTSNDIIGRVYFSVHACTIELVNGIEPMQSQD